MLAIIVSWICIFFVLITLGNMLLLLYKNVTGKTEEYNIIDTFITGICFSAFLLATLSFWLPVNFNILITLVVICILYWIINFKKLKGELYLLKAYIKQHSLLELLPYGFLACFFILSPIWSFSVKLDPFIYHHANIMWNESYAVIPGLANLDEKFGFNSNYFLLSSLFSLRPLFGELIVGLQSLLAYLIAAYTYSEIIKTKFDLRRIALFFIYIILIFFNQNEMSETSTDIIPTLIIFYFLSKLILYPDSLKRDFLFYIIVPVVLITFKLSTSLIIIVSLAPVYFMIQRKEYKNLTFILLFSFLIIFPWIIRNIIISGYPVFPLYNLDLFDFDWKVPADVVQTQKDFIHTYSIDKIVNILSTWDLKNYFFYSTTLVLIFCGISLLCGIIYLFKNRKTVHPTHVFVFGVVFINIIFWALSAPDVRFGYGLIFAIIFFAFYLLLPKTPNSILSQKLVKIKSQSVSAGLIILLTFSLIWGFYGYRWASKYKNYLINRYEVKEKDAWREMLAMPMKLSYQEERELERENERFGTNDQFNFEAYPLNNTITLYVSSSKLGFVFNRIPAVSDCERNPGILFHNYRMVEARGENINNGFRHK